jgi:hypothetical protein
LAHHITGSLATAMQTLPAVKNSSGSATSMNEQRAREMIEPYSHDQKTQISTIIIPAGSSVLEALHDLNELLRLSPGRPGIEAKNLQWLEKLP